MGLARVYVLELCKNEGARDCTRVRAAGFMRERSEKSTHVRGRVRKYKGARDRIYVGTLARV